MIIIRNYLFLLCLLFGGPMLVYAQNDTLEVIKPILLDKAVLSGIGLKKIDLKDEPEKEFYQKNLFHGKDISVYVVSTQSWVNTCKNYPFDEFVYMFHGDAKVSPTTGEPQTFHSRDFFFAHRGFNGFWEILADDKLHYELSIISTKRADSSRVVQDQMHELISKEMISGFGLLNESGPGQKALASGAELACFLHVEIEQQKKLEEPGKEKFIHVLSGQITVHDKSGNKSVFHTGDFFVLPQGFTGMWTTEGHSLVKYLSVERSF